jgi:hypothetical protein
MLPASALEFQHHILHSSVTAQQCDCSEIERQYMALRNTQLEVHNNTDKVFYTISFTIPYFSAFHGISADHCFLLHSIQFRV